MIIIKQVVPTDEEVIKLIDELNAFQISLYGIVNCNLESPDSLMQNNAYMAGAFIEGELVGIGAVKMVDDYGEVKRMFAKQQYRRLSVAKTILDELESYSRQTGIHSLYQETGNLHHAAIKFYQRQGYQTVESFGNYQPNSVSIYFKKDIL